MHQETAGRAFPLASSRRPQALFGPNNTRELHDFLREIHFAAPGGVFAVQGNVDPLALLAGGGALEREVDDVMETLSGGSCRICCTSSRTGQFFPA